MNVVIVDAWTDDNRGDCALQLGLIQMVRDIAPGAKVTGIFRFGHNELAEAEPEIAYTAAALDGYIGGPRRTLYARQNGVRRSIGLHKLFSLFSFVELAFWLVLYRLGLSAVVLRPVRNAFDHMANADVVIWKGKNFRAYGGLGGLQRQMTLTCNGLIASLLNSNVHCVNASIWPVSESIEGKLVKLSLQRCQSVGVRDRESKANAEALSLREVRFDYDLSFYLLRHLATDDALARWKLERKVGRTAAITVTSWGSASQRRQYLAQLTDGLEELKARGFTGIVVVPQVTRQAEDNSEDVVLLGDAAKNLGLEFENLQGAPAIEQLLEIYSRCDLLIGTRMHSCAFALMVETPFVAIAYDHGPKWGVLEEIVDYPVLAYGSSGLAEAVRQRLADDPDKLRQYRLKALAAAEASVSNVRFLA